MLEQTSLIAFARFSRDGRLVEANGRFSEICASSGAPLVLTELVVAGQRQEVSRLLDGGAPPDHRRAVHFAPPDGEPVSLMVTWGWDGEDLLLVGEPAIADLQATQAVLVKLNKRVTDLARENAKKGALLARALDDLRAAESGMVHREKMAALGQMTAGVAHELNNPLAYVRSNLWILARGVDSLLGLINMFGDTLDAVEAAQPELYEQIMDRSEDIDLPHLGEQLPEMLAAINEGVERAGELVSSLRTFSRLDEATVKTVDLNESVQSVVRFAGFLLREKGTRLSLDLAALPPVTCAPAELNQAVLNILVNAIQASPPGATIGLSTCMSEEGEVLISILDHGPGVPPEVAERIFDPFFTTRDVGAGTGLGLSIAQAAIAAQGGRITLETPEPGGARFTIHLPAASAPPASNSPGATGE